jgi:hypothetical protein
MLIMGLFLERERERVKGWERDERSENVDDGDFERLRRDWRSCEPSVWGSGRRLKRKSDRAIVVKYLSHQLTFVLKRNSLLGKDGSPSHHRSQEPSTFPSNLNISHHQWAITLPENNLPIVGTTIIKPYS